MSVSRIEWTDATWNPVTGCSKISEGCLHCYAEKMSMRLKAMGQANYRNGFEVTCHEHMLDYPLRWRKPRTIFVNSMSDLFHEKIPDEFIFRVFEIMKRASWHRFQILTKRAERMKTLSKFLPWPENIWLGVTVENDGCRGRIDVLKTIPASGEIPVDGALAFRCSQYKSQFAGLDHCRRRIWARRQTYGTGVGGRYQNSM